MEWALTSEVVTAREMAQYGVVNRATDDFRTTRKVHHRSRLLRASNLSMILGAHVVKLQLRQTLVVASAIKVSFQRTSLATAGPA